MSSSKICAMDSMMEEREELMVPPTGGKPTLRTACFLRPVMEEEENRGCSAPPSPLASSFRNGIRRFKVRFNGFKIPMKGWKFWVDRLKPTYEQQWKRAGILDAILCSTYHIRKDKELVLKLVEKWCTETNSFVFPWGEASITLEDMMVMGGYSVLGESVLSRLEDIHMIETEKILINAHCLIAQDTGCWTSHYSWMHHFMGTGHCLEHEAFLILWLSRFVFPPKYNNNISKFLFPIAIKLSRGICVALAPAVLCSIYRDFRILKETALSMNNLDASSSCRKFEEEEEESKLLLLTSPMQLVQLWAWERFVTLGKEPNPITNYGKPRIARWHKLSKFKVKNVGEVLDGAGDGIFRWRPYTTKLVNWDFQFGKFYRDRHGYILVDPDMDTEVESMIRCLRVSLLVGLDCIEQYLPHRVSLQFGYDQDLPGYVSRSNMAPEIAWRHYNRPVRDVALHTPARLFEGDVTKRYLEWWHELKSQNGTNAALSLPEEESGYNKKDNLQFAEEFTVNDAYDYLTLEQFKNLKRYLKSLGDNHESLPTAKRMLLSTDSAAATTTTAMIKLGNESLGSETEENIETAMDGGSRVEAIESVENKEIILRKYEHCLVVGEVNIASESREMNDEIRVLQRPDKLRNRMMFLEHRIRNLEKISADLQST